MLDSKIIERRQTPPADPFGGLWGYGENNSLLALQKQNDACSVNVERRLHAITEQAKLTWNKVWRLSFPETERRSYSERLSNRLQEFSCKYICGSYLKRKSICCIMQS